VRRGRLRGVISRLPGGSRPRAVLGALCALAAVALAIGIILGTGLTSSSQGASPAARVSGAATVQRRDLVATDTESGTLTYSNPQTVYNRIAGTITWLPAVGQLIKPGHALYYVDNQPVVLFNGATPAYRDLTAGISNGPDIKELNQDLVSMGFDPNHEISVNDTWQTGTTDAVDRWQSSLGESQTGSITLGQVVFLPGSQRVTTVDAVLGSTGSSSGGAGSGTGSGSASGSGSGSSSSTSGTADPRPEFASLETTTPTRTSTTGSNPGSSCTPTSSKKHHSSGTCGGNSTEAVLIALLKAEVAELQRELTTGAHGAAGSAGGAAGAAGRGAAAGGSKGGAGGVGVGGSAAGSGAAAGTGASGSGGSASGAGGSATAQPILQTTSTQLTAVVDLDATKQSEAVVGEPVTVQLPDGSIVNGKITQVSAIAQNSSSSSGSSGSSGAGGSSGTPSATIPVTIALHGRLPASGLDQAAVSVNFQQQKSRRLRRRTV
jgi:hypothetical protein